jgi:hypothetical protein
MDLTPQYPCGPGVRIERCHSPQFLPASKGPLTGEDARAELERTWPLLEAAILAYAPTHEIEHVWQKIETSNAQLWTRSNAALVTEIRLWPTGLREAIGWLAGGDLDQLRPRRLGPQTRRLSQRRNPDDEGTCLMSGGGTQTTTEQSQTSYPQWSQDAQQNTYGVGKGMMENFLRNPQYATAGFSTDQLKGFDLARDSARQVYTAPQLSAPGSPDLTAAMSSAAQVTPGAIQAGMNPYLDSVGKTTLDALRREHLNNDAMIAAKYAAQGGTGGSGAAIARGQAARGYNETVASTIAQLQSAGYDKATALALANSQMQQQTGLANQSAENVMRTTGADYGLKATQVDDQLRNTLLARQQAAQQGIMQGGTQQQQQAQTTLNTPWTMLQMLMGLTPQQVNSQTYGTKETEGGGTSMFQSLLGAGTTLLGAKTAGGGSIAASLLGLSDEREKTDIEKLGKDPETGLQLYSYRYKGDPKTYPKVTGPMAADVEKRFPGSTQEVGGRTAVPMSMLNLLNSKKAA